MVKKTTPIYFITGNKNKFLEAKAILPNIIQLEIDLPEIQEIDSKKIIEAKLIEAYKLKKGTFIVEDTSLYLDCMQGLPGPLIKWFLQTIGNKGLYDLTQKYNNSKALAKTIVGYAKNEKEFYFFEGIVEGEIVKPTVPTNFGWDPLFKPNGYDKSFAEMTIVEKNKISMRKIAFENLKLFLDKLER